MNKNETLEIVRFNEVSEQEYNDYIIEWESTNELIVPSATNRKGRSFLEMMNKWILDETDDAYKNGFVPSTLYYMINDNRKIIGAIHFRQQLNDRLIQNGGNVGYGIRPSERRKGYATIMLYKLLKMLKNQKNEKVLITCDEDNIASAITIEKANGKLQDKVSFQGVMTRRYWIYL